MGYLRRKNKAEGATSLRERMTWIRAALCLMLVIPGPTQRARASGAGDKIQTQIKQINAENWYLFAMRLMGPVRNLVSGPRVGYNP
jgi:hypothetical protein